MEMLEPLVFINSDGNKKFIFPYSRDATVESITSQKASFNKCQINEYHITPTDIFVNHFDWYGKTYSPLCVVVAESFNDNLKIATTSLNCNWNKRNFYFGPSGIDFLNYNDVHALINFYQESNLNNAFVSTFNQNYGTICCRNVSINLVQL